MIRFGDSVVAVRVGGSEPKPADLRAGAARGADQQVRGARRVGQGDEKIFTWEST